MPSLHFPFDYFLQSGKKRKDKGKRRKAKGKNKTWPGDESDDENDFRPAKSRKSAGDVGVEVEKRRKSGRLRDKPRLPFEEFDLELDEEVRMRIEKDVRKSIEDI